MPKTTKSDKLPEIDKKTNKYSPYYSILVVWSCYLSTNIFWASDIIDQLINAKPRMHEDNICDTLAGKSTVLVLAGVQCRIKHGISGSLLLAPPHKKGPTK